MTSQLPNPRYTTIAALKGLAISASFLTTGSLATLSLASLPAILHTAETSHVAAAQQFALVHKAGKATLPPAEILTTLAYGSLAWFYRRDIGYILEGRSAKWKLYAGAAVAMFSVVPWTLALMESSAQKLVRLAERNPSTSMPTTGGKDPQTSDTPAIHLSAPAVEGHQSGMMTPAAEFEPYEDSPFNDEEYEREKVKKMIKEFAFRNSVRTFAPLLAGVLGLWAVLE